jgi:hypothetical protein
MAKPRGDLLRGAALNNLAFFAVAEKLDGIEPTLDTLSGLTLSPEQNATFFTYDSSGNITQISGAAKQTVFTYTASGDINTIEKTVGDFSVIKSISYNSSGEITSITVN